MLKYFLFFILSFSLTAEIPDNLQNVPSAFKGRFRPLEVSAQLHLYDLYHNEYIETHDLKKFHSISSALQFFWHLHFLGHSQWDTAPLFWISDSHLKKLLELNEKRISYQEAFQRIYENQTINLRLMQPLLSYFFAKKYFAPTNRSHTTNLELTELSPGLWIQYHQKKLIVNSAPKNPPWNFLKKGFIISDLSENLEILEKKYKKTAEALLELMTQLKLFSEIESQPIGEQAYKNTLTQLRAKNFSPAEIAQILENTHPLSQRAAHADSFLKLLPSKRGDGEWLPIKSLKLMLYNPSLDKLEPVSNFTAYSDTLFNSIRTTYLNIEQELQNSTPNEKKIRQLNSELATQLQQGYHNLVDFPYREATGKMLSYPSTERLSAELIYYQYPFVSITIFLYAFAFLLMCSGKISQKFQLLGTISLICAFVIHTMMLVMRCYILQRPPVSNMFETVIYVPWVTVVMGFLLYYFFRQRFILISTALIPSLLLLILQATDLNAGLENPQAVLDSQYWLIIHVLLVVGSYGAFILCGILGHFYLGSYFFNHYETTRKQFIAKCILQTMYIGVAMLVPGTILGGVWAAESWGRFWDWDPKESWAFISICTYLIWIHSFRFGRIQNFGLAVGSIIGFQIITFTWYGVNYILGTGLHTYGFGNGGEIYYYLFLLAEALFLISVWNKVRNLANNTEI